MVKPIAQALQTHTPVVSILFRSGANLASSLLAKLGNSLLRNLRSSPLRKSPRFPAGTMW